MKVNIQKKDCKFYINQTERTIVCVIQCNPFIVVDYVDDFIDDYLWLPPRSNKIRMPSTFIGKAVCSADDEWNEELGRDIAFERAKDKFYRSFFKRANTYIRIVDDKIKALVESFNLLGTQVETNMKSLRRTINERVK